MSEWWIDKLATSTTTSSVSYHGRTAPANLDLAPKEVRKQVDWNPDRTLAWSLITDLASGTYVRTDYGYPAVSHGQPTSAIVSGNPLTGTRETRTVYTTDGYFPASVTAVLSASNPSLNHTTTTDVRASDGQPRSVTDPNGLKSVSEYDVFGRPTLQTVLGNDNLPLAPSTHTRLSDGAPSQRTWFDILGREVRRTSRGLDGRWVASTTRYDTQGAVRESSAPYFAGETPLFTQFTFDRYNRVRTKRAPTAELNAAQGDVLTKYTYAGLRTDVRVELANGQCQLAANLCFDLSRQHNALGQLMRTKDAQGGLTDYWMDPIGNAAALRDANGRATLASYNGFGHRVTSSDPNQGVWNFTYNALGELLTQTDARQVRTSIVQRDALGRVLQQQREPLLPVVANGPLADEKTRDTWEYDTAGIKGQLASVKRERLTPSDPNWVLAWQESYGYELNSGRLHSRSTSIGAGPLVSLTYSYQYDPYYGYLSGVTYPNSPQPLTVWKRYTRYGAPTGLVDARLMTPLWSMSQADAYGKPTQEQFGYALSGSTSYSRATGQMLSQAWQPFDRPTFNDHVDKIGYGYDVLGNLVNQDRTWRRYELSGRFNNVLIPTTVTGEHRGRGVETYSYDTLQRLLSVERNVNQWHPNANHFNEWSLAPADPPQIDYQYDAVGNIWYKSDFASSYAYGTAATPADVGTGAGLCGPNALRQTTLPGLQRDYLCDSNGNQVRETYTGGVVGSRKVIYDGANLPTRIDHTDTWNTASVGFAYGPDNARYSRTTIGSAAATYYGAEGYEQEYQPGTPSRTLHRVELGPVVYTRVVTAAHGSTPSTAAPAQVAYQLRDRLGSTVAIADRWGHFNGTVTGSFEPFPTADGLLRRFYDPFGAPRYSNFAGTATLPELRFGQTSVRGFTGHEHLDGARLIHMNGRAFDYRSGRFLSVDPFVQDPGDSQSPNPYSYIGNNPLSGTDPSGYAACVSDKEKTCSDLGPARQNYSTNAGFAFGGIAMLGGGPTGNGKVKDPLATSVKELYRAHMRSVSAIGGLSTRDSSAPLGSYENPVLLSGEDVTPGGSRTRDYGYAYQMWMLPSYMQERAEWIDYYAASIANRDAIELGKTIGKGAVGATVCAATAGGCAVMGAYQVVQDVEQGNYKTAFATAVLTVGGIGASTRGMAGTAPGRLATSNEMAAEIVRVRQSSIPLSIQKQARHVMGESYKHGGFFASIDDAKRLYENFLSGKFQALGFKNESLIFRSPDIMGFNVNAKAGFSNQPADVFMLKGSKSPSLVPINPNWKP